MPAEFDRLRLAIKGQLKKDNPGLSEDELENKSFAIATMQWKKTHGGKGPNENTDSKNLDDIDEEPFSDEEKFDEQGRLIIGENVKFIIDGSINTIEV